MYKSFFGLRENPFNANPDPRYLFLTREIQEALAGLAYGIKNRKGFILLTGEVGTGKTTLLNRLLDWLNLEGVATAYIFNSQLDTSQLFDFMMADFGIPCESRDKSHVLMRLNHWLLQRYRDRKTSVLIVDEAQNLSFEVLEEIRLLTNFETANEKLLQIVLSGQPELEEKLRDPRLRQLRQRITMRCRTQPLSFEEMTGYINERLRIGGANGTPVFSSYDFPACPSALWQADQPAVGFPRALFGTSRDPHRKDPARSSPRPSRDSKSFPPKSCRSC